MDKILLPFRQSKLLNTLFLSNVFLSLHYALIIYVNSSFLNNFFSETQISALYIIGSVLDTVILLNASKIIEKVGSFRFAVYLIVIEFLATLGLAVSVTPFLLGLYFLIHLVTISLLLFNMDIFVESVTKNEKDTGSIRATYLTLTNITLVIAPMIIALVLINNIYSYVYLLSSFSLIPLYFLIKRFKKVEMAQVHHIRIKETLWEYFNNKNLYNIFISHTLLQFFYGFMVIYMPIYLNKYIGFSWSEIGIMFTIMLLPFILFEIPVGELADDRYGEKEFLTIGFVIIGLSTLSISFVALKSFWIWATILFITRIGASIVEVSTESYFFKQVDQQKTDIISFFRISRPVSFVMTPLVFTIALQFIPFQYAFILLGSIMIMGAHSALALKDTK